MQIKYKINIFSNKTYIQLGKNPYYGFHYNGSCVPCNSNCIECFFGYQGKNNYTQTNTYDILTSAQALEKNLTLQCGTCAFGYTLNWDFKTCIKCPNFCETCYYASLTNKNSKYPSLYTASSLPTEAKIISDKIDLRCLTCPLSKGLNSTTMNCTLTCNISLCSNCEYPSSGGGSKPPPPSGGGGPTPPASQNQIKCKSCVGGYFVYSKKTNGTEETICTACSLYIKGCIKCNIKSGGSKGGDSNSKDSESTCSLCQEGWFLNSYQLCSTCSGCSQGACLLMSSSNKVK